MKLILNVFKICEFNGSDLTEIVPMVIPVLVVVTHDATIVTTVQSMIDVRKVVTGYCSVEVNPDLATKLTIATFWRDVVQIVDNFSISHDS
ncbi:hypothetical protein, partial [Propionivibrio sp.]|uniref:hypothetical protein n=1 Tax=Propionivibrio sp. TaxID=2212460 RepID=UPI003BF177B1